MNSNGRNSNCLSIRLGWHLFGIDSKNHQPKLCFWDTRVEASRGALACQVLHEISTGSTHITKLNDSCSAIAQLANEGSKFRRQECPKHSGEVGVRLFQCFQNGDFVIVRIRYEDAANRMAGAAQFSCRH